MKRSSGPGVWLAALAAIAVVLGAWLLPWRDIISGDEQLAPQRMPQTREAVAKAQENFGKASAQYQSYVKTHDLAALLDRSKAAISQAQDDPSNVGALVPVRDAAGQVQAYAAVLENYAAASDAYLKTLRGYDDDLMSWTRGLFGASEPLRSQTWPFVEHLRLYPQPVGLKTDPPMVSAQQVSGQSVSLQEHVAALSTQDNRKAALDSISRDIADIWESGRSVEYVAGLNPDYMDELSAYDTKVQAAALTPVAAVSPGDTGQVSSWGLNLIVGVLTLGGLTALFMPRTEPAV